MIASGRDKDTVILDGLAPHHSTTPNTYLCYATIRQAIKGIAADSKRVYSLMVS